MVAKTGCDGERISAVASYHFSRMDFKRGPIEQECMAVLWAVAHFWPCLEGREVRIVTDCSALI